MHFGGAAYLLNDAYSIKKEKSLPETSILFPYVQGFFDSWQTIHFTIRLTGYFFNVIVKPRGLMGKAPDSLRYRSLIPHVVTYDLAKSSKRKRDPYVVIF